MEAKWRCQNAPLHLTALGDDYLEDLKKVKNKAILSQELDLHLLWSASSPAPDHSTGLTMLGQPDRDICGARAGLSDVNSWDPD